MRALEIIDLMAAQPAEKFTLSDIMRFTGTNASSLHAILNVMMQRGYLLRDPERKTYRLAPALVAIGEAAARHDPLLEQARQVASAWAARSGRETLLTARAGSDIIGVARFAVQAGMSTSLRVGQRVPLRAPLGGLFIAWSDEEDIAAWCAPRDQVQGQVVSQSAREGHERALQLLRHRGFLVSLRSAEHGAFTRHLADVEEGAGAQASLAMLLAAMDNGLYQPPEIHPDGEYSVRMLSVPIFDRHRRVLYNIGVSYPHEPVRGAQLLAEADSLVEACSAIWADAAPAFASGNT
ncbi:hypothetical protein JI59_09900 [Novosphingobium pentaromativorans US6-1]|uniref:IclR family transcriptional regulator n=1 Tax=Novosphingobium pentaromativorans US6-1 TaxID=1088721 RepID=G6ECG6_9SPHN|nr:hypothetical protein JI59_09900 [Novosphingobium pentaromativorans US6-1]EHJ60877.1 hypothetical protein NSU_2037 [Novosphingobium pentaromativorans US6-1]